MPAIKPIDQIARKYVEVTPQRTNEYAAGVAAPRVSWLEATRAAVASWKQAITEAVAGGSFLRGVERATDAKWKRGASGKGVARWAKG